MSAQNAPLSYDYVLVGKTKEEQDKESYKKQKAFIEALKCKKLKVTVSLYSHNNCPLRLVSRITNDDSD